MPAAASLATTESYYSAVIEGGANWTSTLTAVLSFGLPSTPYSPRVRSAAELRAVAATLPVRALPPRCDRQWRERSQFPSPCSGYRRMNGGRTVESQSSNLSSQVRCSRCLREPRNDADYVTWSALDEGAVCPGCLTLLETETARAGQ